MTHLRTAEFMMETSETTLEPKIKGKHLRNIKDIKETPQNPVIVKHRVTLRNKKKKKNKKTTLEGRLSRARVRDPHRTQET